VGIELSGGLVALCVGCFSLVGGGGLGVLLLPLVVREPVVVGSVRSVLVVGTMDARVVALPPVLWVFVVVWQGTALVVTDELFLLNYRKLVACRLFPISGTSYASPWVWASAARKHGRCQYCSPTSSNRRWVPPSWSLRSRGWRNSTPGLSRSWCRRSCTIFPAVRALVDSRWAPGSRLRWCLCWCSC
jgi:hypothetical protein